MKIQLIEDNRVFTDQFCKLLKKKDIEYSCFDSISTYSFEEVDAYIVDLQIGSEMSYDIIKEISSKTNKPVVLLSHHTDRNKISRAVDCGITYIISKFDYELYGIHLDLILKHKNI